MELEDKNFKVDLQRAKVYWSYYKTILTFACLGLLTAVISISILHLAGSLSFMITAILIVISYILLLVLILLMTYVVWRHENRHLDELMELELMKKSG